MSASVVTWARVHTLSVYVLLRHCNRQVHAMLLKMRYKGGGGVTRTELDVVMQELDKDGDGDIHFDEFAEW